MHLVWGNTSQTPKLERGQNSTPHIAAVADKKDDVTSR